MIKLDNKNITYVALADSNNSFKAPKEIWYADSSNSVKLVYRRKDALIEGVDYEKYHWLKGDGAAYIDTDIIVDVPSLYINTKFTKVESPSYNYPLFGSRDSVNYKGSHIFYLIDQHLRVDVLSGATAIDLLVTNQENTLIVDVPNNKIILNGVTTNGGLNDYSRKNSVNTFRIFGLKEFGSSSNAPYEGQFSEFILNDSTHSLHLTPCKLLKPVPKWLDANGIRRQVGECGMIDLISGKFYGNVNSVGTFTVENYYERKEWLVGDGSAYIDTGHNVNEDLDYETKVHLLPNTYLFWYRSGNPYNDQTMVVRSNNPSLYTGSRVAKNSIDVRIGDIENVEVQWNNNKALVNGVNYIRNDRAITFNYGLYLFYAYLADTALTNYSSNDVKCAYFRFLDSNRNYILNLIPCTLTMDLPASMDANNIARTKGTSGMWDLVSDRFYGNVASSGTFKAVNLAEGVDYEVYDWLVGDGSAYISGITYNLWDNHLVSQIYNMNKSYRQFVQSDINLNDRNISMTRNSIYLQIIFRESSQTNITHIADLNPNDFSGAIDLDYYISDSSFNVKVNGVTYTNATSAYATESKWDSFDGLLIYSEKMSYIREITPSGIYVSNLIPVKLLKSIPAKYDANGIARNAGECGMYDTVNDVFYGNVASSGSFTVEDDN